MSGLRMPRGVAWPGDLGCNDPFHMLVMDLFALLVHPRVAQVSFIFMQNYESWCPLFVFVPLAKF